MRIEELGMDRRDHLEEIASLQAEVMKVPFDAAEVAHQLDHWNPSCHLRRWAAWSPEGALMGVGRLAHFAPTAPLSIRVLVRPAFRRQGVGSSLFELALAGAKEAGSRRTVAWVDGSSHEARDWLARRGYKEVSETLESTLKVLPERRPLWESLVSRASSRGFRITTLAASDTPEMRRAFFAAYGEADQDTPDVVELGIYDWESFQSDIYGAIWFRPEGAFMALDGDRIVGVTLGGVRSPSEPSRFTTDFTGVVREARGQGLSTSLKAAFALWALDHGAETIVTKNNSQNAPILSANRSLGFEVTSSDIMAVLSL